VKRLLGFVGHHYGFGRVDLLDMPLLELAYWAEAARLGEAER
jgi:hypothetical protein